MMDHSYWLLQLLRNRLVATARNCMRKQEPLGQVYGSMQDAYWQMQTPLTRQETSTQVCIIVVLLSLPLLPFAYLT